VPAFISVRIHPTVELGIAHTSSETPEFAGGINSQMVEWIKFVRIREVLGIEMLI
jgi:hypothetical protein